MSYLGWMRTFLTEWEHLGPGIYARSLTHRWTPHTIETRQCGSDPAYIPVHHILEWETLWQTLVSENWAESQGSHSFFLHAALEKIRTPITSPFLRCIIWYNYKSLEKLIWQFPCWYSIFPHYYQTHCSKPLLFTFFILSHQIIIEIPSICELNTHLKAHISHHFSVSSSPSLYYCPAFSLSCILSQELN